MKRRACVLIVSSVVSLCTAAAGSWISLVWPSQELLPSVLGVVSLLSLAGLLAAFVAYVVTDILRLEWRRAFLTGLLGGACVLALFAAAFAASLCIMFFDVDHFADGLKLPEDVVLREPVGDSQPRYYTPPSAPGDIRLTEGGQGGLYEADVWCNPGGPGTVYLRVFEITRGTELSRHRLPGRTRRDALYDADPAKMLHHRMDFTIYEGNWGQHYGARFELWFRPSDGRPERKLLERNYRVEGWMR